MFQPHNNRHVHISIISFIHISLLTVSTLLISNFFKSHLKTRNNIPATIKASCIMACSHRRRRDKTVLCGLQLCSHHRHDSFVLSRPSFHEICLVSTQFQWVLSRLDPVSMSFVSSRPSFQFATMRSLTSNYSPARLDPWYTVPVPPRPVFIQILDLAWPSPLQAMDKTAYKHWFSCQRSIKTGPRYLPSSAFLRPSLAYIKVMSLCRCDCKKISK